VTSSLPPATSSLPPVTSCHARGWLAVGAVAKALARLPCTGAGYGAPLRRRRDCGDGTCPHAAQGTAPRRARTTASCGAHWLKASARNCNFNFNQCAAQAAVPRWYLRSVRTCRCCSCASRDQRANALATAPIAKRCAAYNIRWPARSLTWESRWAEPVERAVREREPLERAVGESRCGERARGWGCFTEWPNSRFSACSRTAACSRAWSRPARPLVCDSAVRVEVAELKLQS
jgi:hypothetical protein